MASVVPSKRIDLHRPSKARRARVAVESSGTPLNVRISCGGLIVRPACPNCHARDSLETIKLANKGKLYNYCIVFRSYPGIDVPYISAVVDLEGGGTVKGCLINIDPDPEKIKFDMPVEVVYQDALGRKDAEGNSYISYFFQPA